MFLLNTTVSGGGVMGSESMEIVPWRQGTYLVHAGQK